MSNPIYILLALFNLFGGLCWTLDTIFLSTPPYLGIPLALVCFAGAVAWLICIKKKKVDTP